ncbi:MAG: cupin domain-containing protein [Rhodobacteraceae bacterium]|nr:cupin domain-containing protein [Paracoccaceae bacterium]
MDMDGLIARLGLLPHPEGGHYRETWRAEAPRGQRPSGTAILFLLKAGETSHWHRVDSTEIWLFHAGAPLTLSISATEQGPAQDRTLAPLAPQCVVPAHHWQTARSTGDFTLVSCIVSPGFDFAGFTLAPPGFDIPGRG